jgi:exonuclease V gamma subunit
MAIELYFSNQLDQLAYKFSDVVTEEIRGKADILDPPVVIVPNANLARWLQLFLARENSIFMNIGFQYLEEGLWGMLAAIDPGETKPDPMDIEQLKILLLHILQNLDQSDTDFLPVTRYLFGEDGGERPDHAARLWQLSEKLAHLFKEYEFHRTGMIRRWSESATAAKGMERCQQRLYIQLKRLRDKCAGDSGKRMLSLMEYADQVLSGRGSNGKKDREPPNDTPNDNPSDEHNRDGAKDHRIVHFFGLSQISAFHLNLIGRLKPYYMLNIYSMNPSEAYWEDIKTPGEKRWIQRKNVTTLFIRTDEHEQGELFGLPDNDLLAAWGKPGRESVRLLCELTDYDFNACFAPFDHPSSILQRIQNEILTRSVSGRDTPPAGQDRSLQIVACPGITREVETVFNSILYNLEQDDTLQLTDIAILVPDISTYKPVFDSVFDRRPGQISYNLVDAHADIESVYGKAVLAILKLATGRFSRNEVFDLVLNPCFMNRWKIDPEEVHVWANWTGELNIFHTFDRQSKIARGYPASGSFTWKQGLQRLRLSRIMAAPNVTDPEGFLHYQEFIPYSDVNTGDEDLVEKFCMVIEALHHTVSRLNVHGATGEQWKQLFLRACDQLIEIPDDIRGEAAVRQSLARALDNLDLYDRLQDEPARSPLNLELIGEFVRSNLGAISGGHGNYLTGGVTISALQPMRPIPFRIIYVLGMEEGNFPGKAELSSLDLRLLKRRIGDINLPERNCYLFLEMLLSVREKLYISYVSRDLQKDRLQQPCSVINQLKRYVEQRIFSEGHPFRVADIPLSGSSSRYCGPDAVNAWSDVVVNDSLSDRVAYYRIHQQWDAFKQKASVEDLKRVERFDPDLSFDAPAPGADDRWVEKITTRQLRKFLEQPVRQKVQRHLGLYDEAETIEDVALREDEPFFSEFPLDYRLKMETIRHWIDRSLAPTDSGASPMDPEAFYDFAYDTGRRKGQTPEGAFAEIDRDEIKGDLGRIRQTLEPVLERMRSAVQLFRSVFVGDPALDPVPSDGRFALKRFGPVVLTVQTADAASETIEHRVELHGQLPWIWQETDGAWYALVLTGSGKKNREPDKYALEPVLSYLLCLAGDESSRWFEGFDRPSGEPFGMTLIVVYRDIVKEWTYTVDRETAAAYLNELVSAALNRSMTEWLPFEAVTGQSIKPHKIPDDEVNDIVRMQFAAEIEDALTQEEDYLIRIAKPVIPADAFDRVRSRFKLFFDTSSK